MINKNIFINMLIFGSPNFEDNFPEVEEITITHSDKYDNPTNKWPSIYNKSSFKNKINCKKPGCNGGLEVSDLLRKMLEDSMTEIEGTEICHGNIGSSKGRRVYAECWNQFDYKIVIVKKET